MPIKIPKSLPAYKALTDENVFVMTEERAARQDIRPLKVAIVNLMPTTVDTEIQLLRLLGSSPLQVDISFFYMGSHTSRNAPPGHLERFYTPSHKACKDRFDGLIITGAPVETLPFEEVDYWDELAAVMSWAKTNVFSTMHICWGAQAGLYHHYGIPKLTLPSKLFGVFAHNINARNTPLFRGFDDIFLAPQSRHTESSLSLINVVAALTVQSATACGSPFILTARNGREIYVTGHLEYDVLTLDKEYRRDLALGKTVNIPQNYYTGDDPARPPIVRWRAHAHLFFSNWLNFIYQETPFDLAELAS
ncbi:MAG: homoserine O-succinyltransferase [Spirochaetaceae bacterium]|jgi:homoserine O-succinyltransferase|nr:homoserine O-succinyltransferase [Spirochaetaceae bacterium]